MMDAIEKYREACVDHFLGKRGIIGRANKGDGVEKISAKLLRRAAGVAEYQATPGVLGSKPEKIALRRLQAELFGHSDTLHRRSLARYAGLRNLRNLRRGQVTKGDDLEKLSASLLRRSGSKASREASEMAAELGRHGSMKEWKRKKLLAAIARRKLQAGKFHRGANIGKKARRIRMTKEQREHKN